MSDSPNLPSLFRTRSHRSVFKEEFGQQHSSANPGLGLGNMAAAPTLRDMRRLASDHEFVFGGNPKPRRLGWWPFIAAHLSLPAALGAGIIFVVVAVVYTSEISKQVLECPAWAETCNAAHRWTAENLGTIQGIITLIYLIGMMALGYAALGVCEAMVWPLLHKQAFTIKGLEAFLSTTRGSIMAAPVAAISVRTVAAGFVLACALLVMLLPLTAPPLVGYAYTPVWQDVQLESNYTPGGGIAELYAQTSLPASVTFRTFADYSSWAMDPESEPMPEYRDWYIDRKTLGEKGSFIAEAVKLNTSISCRPHRLQQVNVDNAGHGAFRTNMTQTNRSTTAEVWARPQAQLTTWVDHFDFVSNRRTRATLVFAALNGTIEGGNSTRIGMGTLRNASSVACEVDIEAADSILSVGLPAPSDTDDLPVLSSTEALTVSAAASPQTRLNELLLWFATAPLMAGTSADGWTQPMFLNSTATGRAQAYPGNAAETSNNWTTAGLEEFIRLSIGALAQATSTTRPSSNSTTSAAQQQQQQQQQLLLTTSTPTRKLQPWRAHLLALPPSLSAAALLAVAVLAARLHARLGIPVMRQAGVGELLKSAQTAWLREQAGVDAAKTYLPHGLGALAVRYAVDDGAGGGLVGLVDGSRGAAGDGVGAKGGLGSRGGFVREAVVGTGRR